MKQEKDTVRESSYDGIQEYDNDLPKWWLTLFYITIGFAVIYSVYAVAYRGTSEELLARELAAIASSRPPPPATIPATALDLERVVSDPAQIAAGKGVFASKCAACHGAAGQGVVGPNLTDKFWIHGGTLSDIKKTIENGVIAKGMIAWKGIISDAEIVSAIAFIHSIRNSNPAAAKAPEGAPYEG